MKIATENSINWGEDPWGRRAQIQREFWEIEAATDYLINELLLKQEAIDGLQSGNRSKVDEAARMAYDGLANVVNLLLSVDDGTERLSRRNGVIVDALNFAVINFERLSKVARQATDDLGVSAAQCMSLGDDASSFVKALTSRIETFRSECKPIKDTMDGAEGDHQRSKDAAGDLVRRLNNACAEQNDLGNQFVGFFNSDVKDRIARDISNAQDRVNRNQDEQRRAQDRMMIFYKLWVFMENAVAAFGVLRARLEVVANAFDDAYKLVTTASEVESALYGGLKRLYNNVWSIDFVSNRDNSLRLVLQLLSADDEVFLGQEYYEKAEHDIKAAVANKMGPMAVQELIAPVPPRVSLEQFELAKVHLDISNL